MTTTTSTTPAPGRSPATVVRFGRRPTRGVLLGLSAPRAAALGLYVTIAIIVLTATGITGLVVALVAFAFLPAAVFIRFGGEPAADWVMIGACFAAGQLRGQGRYLTRAPVAARPAGSLALPGDGAALRLQVDEQTGTAMIFDPHRRTVSGVLPVSYPAFPLLDDGQQTQRVARWGRVLAGLAHSGHCAAVQVVEATVPDPGTGQRDWWQRHGRRDGGWAAAQYETLLDHIRLDAAVHRTTITYTLDLKAAARQVRAAGGGVAGAAVVLRGELAGLGCALAGAGLRAGPPLRPAALAAILRSTFDPDAGAEDGSPATNVATAGPVAVAEGWDRLRHDGAFSRVLWLADWPHITVPPDFLHPLLFVPDVRRVVSITCRPAGTGEALRAIRKEKTDAIAERSHKARIGQIADYADTAELDDLLARERSVICGHTDVTFTGLVTVTAPTGDKLDAGTAALTRAASQGACELRTLYGRQAQGFLCGALPLGRRPF